MRRQKDRSHWGEKAIPISKQPDAKLVTRAEIAKFHGPPDWYIDGLADTLLRAVELLERYRVSIDADAKAFLAAFEDKKP